MAIDVVGTGARHKHNVGICPNRVVLGLSGYEDMCLALSVNDNLAYAMGAAIEKTSEWLIAGIQRLEVRILSGTPCFSPILRLKSSV